MWVNFAPHVYLDTLADSYPGAETGEYTSNPLKLTHAKLLPEISDSVMLIRWVEITWGVWQRNIRTDNL
jgi:hypothetical protein